MPTPAPQPTREADVNSYLDAVHRRNLALPWQETHYPSTREIAARVGCHEKTAYKWWTVWFRRTVYGEGGK